MEEEEKIIIRCRRCGKYHITAYKPILARTKFEWDCPRCKYTNIRVLTEKKTIK